MAATSKEGYHDVCHDIPLHIPPNFVGLHNLDLAKPRLDPGRTFAAIPGLDWRRG